MGYVPGWLTTGVLAITAYFHHMRLLGLLAVFAAILAILFGRAITGGVRTFFGFVFGHKNYPAFLLVVCVILRLIHPGVKQLAYVFKVLLEQLSFSARYQVSAPWAVPVESDVPHHPH